MFVNPSLDNHLYLDYNNPNYRIALDEGIYKTYLILIFMKFFKKAKKIYNNTILCIKYPFLYPRNRFTDNHYQNLTIQKKINDLNKKYMLHFHIVIKNEDNFKFKELSLNKSSKWKISQNFKYDDYFLCLVRYGDVGKIIVSHNGIIIKEYKLSLTDKLKEFNLTADDVCGLYFMNWEAKNFMGERIFIPQIVFVIKKENATQDHYFKTTSLNLPLKNDAPFKIKLLKQAERFLSVFHFLPSYTELDAMENGWRSKFGENMCKEIRNSLLKTYIKNGKPTSFWGKIKCYYKGVKHLYSYRIVQIKEKFGSLRWYANGDTRDTLNIIQKYENISENTCIVCGKDATYRSTGWVCPYCDEHKPKYSIKIGEESDNEW